MKIIWKVRCASEQGLVESEFRGSLAELAVEYKSLAVVVIQAVGIAPDDNTAADAARGSDAIAVKKS